MNAFMALIAGILPLVAVIYSWGFMKDETGRDRFYTLLLLMVTGMFGLVFTGDLFNLFIFLEILSISGAALAAFRIRFADSSEGGLKYIVISAIAARILLISWI